MKRGSIATHRCHVYLRPKSVVFMSFMGYFLPFFLGNEIVTALKLTFSRKLGIMSFR